MKRCLAPAVTAVTPGRGLPPTTAEQGPLKIPTPVPRYQRDELCSENPSPRGFLFSLIGFSLANAGAGPRLAALPPPTAAPKAWRCERLPDLCPQGPWGGDPRNEALVRVSRVATDRKLFQPGTRTGGKWTNPAVFHVPSAGFKPSLFWARSGFCRTFRLPSFRPRLPVLDATLLS